MVGIALASEKVVEPRRRVFSGSVCAGSDCPFRVGFSASRSRQLQGPNITHFVLSTEQPGTKVPNCCHL
jgi:hypothetical protein